MVRYRFFIYLINYLPLDPLNAKSRPRRQFGQAVLQPNIWIFAVVVLYARGGGATPL